MASVQDVSPLDRLNREFIEAVREIMYLAIKIDSPYDRVKVMHWVRRLREQDDTKLRAAQIRNEYAQYLRIMLSGETLYFCAPFKKEPPEVLAPLPEALTNMMSEKCPDLPKTGPIQPVMCHKTTDGRAYMCVKRCPEGGVFCYLAVAPNQLQGEAEPPAEPKPH